MLSGLRRETEILFAAYIIPCSLIPSALFPGLDNEYETQIKLDKLLSHALVKTMELKDADELDE